MEFEPWNWMSSVRSPAPHGTLSHLEFDWITPVFWNTLLGTEYVLRTGLSYLRYGLGFDSNSAYFDFRKIRISK